LLPTGALRKPWIVCSPAKDDFEESDVFIREEVAASVTAAGLFDRPADPSQNDGLTDRAGSV
jgi:hypothetical protein